MRIFACVRAWTYGQNQQLIVVVSIFLFLPEEREEVDPTVGQFLFPLCVFASFELAIGL
jgi:hypothetical protein